MPVQFLAAFISYFCFINISHGKRFMLRNEHVFYNFVLKCLVLRPSFIISNEPYKLQALCLSFDVEEVMINP